ncbi:hypothetical protein HDIA_0012 [Hartmannibacter diazotrophicus]|uniref:YjiS-like domain-containing protein n=1 Tax=Hartmannibacter diazotrophicus TaxID=1482074 RepID=A0A2C9CZZ8_9HYPH|nr:DUF1127 domain-containing protein [Hartmannibacter diazotrophicus]SON53553.1 hypothetical protein HDIA_0012 [Hartmannibacter diazotrophicus]
MTIREKFARYTAMRRAVRQLEALDDRSLRDIGIESRAQIRSAIYGA